MRNRSCWVCSPWWSLDFCDNQINEIKLNRKEVNTQHKAHRALLPMRRIKATRSFDTPHRVQDLRWDWEIKLNSYEHIFYYFYFFSGSVLIYPLVMDEATKRTHCCWNSSMKLNGRSKGLVCENNNEWNTFRYGFDSIASNIFRALNENLIFYLRLHSLY